MYRLDRALESVHFIDSLRFKLSIAVTLYGKSDSGVGNHDHKETTCLPN